MQAPTKIAFSATSGLNVSIEIIAFLLILKIFSITGNTLDNSTSMGTNSDPVP